MTPYATLAGQSSHGGIYVANQCSSVLAEGSPPLCAGDTHVCPCVLPSGTPHPSLPLPSDKSGTVLVGGRPWLLAGQAHPCGGPARILAQCSIVQGASSVIDCITDINSEVEPQHARFSA